MYHEHVSIHIGINRICLWLSPVIVRAACPIRRQTVVSFLIWGNRSMRVHECTSLCVWLMLSVQCRSSHKMLPHMLTWLGIDDSDGQRALWPTPACHFDMTDILETLAISTLSVSPGRVEYMCLALLNYHTCHTGL